MLRVLSWYILERLVKIPTSLLMDLHMMLMDKVEDALSREGWKLK